MSAGRSVHRASRKRHPHELAHGIRQKAHDFHDGDFASADSEFVESDAEFHVRKEEHIRGLFLELFTLLEKKPEGFPNEASILCYRILLELSSDHEYTEYPELLSRILNYMAERFNTSISISALCQEFKISSGTVYRLFRTYLKSSPIDYLIGERMKIARSLLLESNTPIKDIAFQVGYENQLYFSSEFRRICGSSPRDFRKKGMQL